jgi:hypothetical protein
MTLSADAILAADDIVTEAVDCPEWGGKVLVKAMTGAERDSSSSRSAATDSST